MVRFGIELVPDRPVMQIVELAQLAEQSGFDNIWVTDHYNNRNLWCTLTTIALNTRRVFIGPGVTNPYHTNPALSAAAAVTLNEISNGRAVVGLGAGDRVTLETLGIDWRLPVTAVMEGLMAIRALTSGEQYTMKGRVFSFRNTRLDIFKRNKASSSQASQYSLVPSIHGQPERIPLYAGVQGPQMLRRVSTIVDGVLINASHPKDFSLAVKIIRESAQEAGRDPQHIDIAAYTVFSMAESREQALSGHARLIIAYVVAGASESALNRHNIDVEDSQQIARELARGDFKKAQELVTDDMIESFAIVGDKTQCISRIEDLLKEGVTHFVMGSPLGPKRDVAIRQFGSEVIPYFRV